MPRFFYYLSLLLPVYPRSSIFFKLLQKLTRFPAPWIFIWHAFSSHQDNYSHVNDHGMDDFSISLNSILCNALNSFIPFIRFHDKFLNLIGALISTSSGSKHYKLLFHNIIAFNSVASVVNLPSWLLSWTKRHSFDSAFFSVVSASVVSSFGSFYFTCFSFKEL